MCICVIMVISAYNKDELLMKQKGDRHRDTFQTESSSVSSPNTSEYDDSGSEYDSNEGF